MLIRKSKIAMFEKKRVLYVAVAVIILNVTLFIIDCLLDL